MSAVSLNGCIWLGLGPGMQRKAPVIKPLGNVFNEKMKLKNVLINGHFLRVFMTGEVLTLFEVEKNRIGITV